MQMILMGFTRHMRRLRRSSAAASIVLMVSIIVIPATVLGWIQPQAALPTDPTAALQARLDRGEVTLQYREGRGYLDSMLEQFGISTSTQTLVFSRTSAQAHIISPATPRALYFTDDVYVGFVRGGDFLEIVSIDPVAGPLFYTLNQDPEAPPRFEEKTLQCLSCHDMRQGDEQPTPRVHLLSVLPDTIGQSIAASFISMTDRIPIRERWGGWYVTGTHGAQEHLGNITVDANLSQVDEIRRGIRDYVAKMDLSEGANVTDLSAYFDPSPYPTPHSDLVALTVLTHQTTVHNAITAALYRFREALAVDMQRSASTGRAFSEPSLSTMRLADELAEPIVHALLFVGAAPLGGMVQGTSNFVQEFALRGPRDSQGRSLRDLDLNARLLRYPLSYMVYAKSFDGLADPVRHRVYRRLHDVLSGRDSSPIFRHLTSGDRRAMLEILMETKPEFTAVVSP